MNHYIMDDEDFTNFFKLIDSYKLNTNEARVGFTKSKHFVYSLRYFLHLLRSDNVFLQDNVLIKKNSGKELVFNDFDNLPCRTLFFNWEAFQYIPDNTFIEKYKRRNND